MWKSNKEESPYKPDPVPLTSELARMDHHPSSHAIAYVIKRPT